MQLRKFIQSRLGIDLYISAVVIFANEKARLSLRNPTVSVLKPDELVSFFKRYPSQKMLGTKELEDLERTIKAYSHFLLSPGTRDRPT
jgi:hypothetical protein